MRNTMSYTELRKKLKSAFDHVCKRRKPMHVTRRNGDNVVIISEDDYESLEETAYLLRSPANAKRLLEALNRKKGRPLKDVRNALGI